jgi:hypothetical protein
VAVRQVTGEDGHPWAQITSAVGYLEKLDLARCLVLAGEAVTGGVVAEDNLVLFRHSIPLGDTAIDGFERPFRLVVEIADRMEDAALRSRPHTGRVPADHGVLIKHWGILARVARLARRRGPQRAATA